MTEQNEHGHDHKGSFSGLHAHEDGALHWHDEFGLHLAEDLSPEEIAAQKLDWRMHNTTIVTVGIDIGSSTTHMMFSRIFVQLMGEGREARSVVVGREILWQSPIILTPYLDEDNMIDARTLRRFISEGYAAVGATANEIDTGSIILTGAALERKNARALGELAASYAGKFVCASAGHHLEAVLAANGSGTVSRSRRDGRTLLNVDIGGGTTKFALVRDGEIVATAAIAIGARQLVKDQEGRLTRIEEPVRRVAESLGIRLALGKRLPAPDEARILDAWLEILTRFISKRERPEGIAADLLLTEPLPDDIVPQAVTFSGGVSEFIFLRESRDFGDLGKPLAAGIRKALSSGAITLPALIDPNLGIRATAIGASQFTIQVGINLYVSDEAILPLRNVPVVVPKLAISGEIDSLAVASALRQAAARIDLDEGEGPVAVAFAWPTEVDVTRQRMTALAQGIRDSLPRTVDGGVPLVLLADQAIARALGAALKEELKIPGELLSVEGIAVREFDFLDVGEVIHPTEVVPLTVKSLLFAGGLDRRSVKQALISAATSHS